MMPRSSTLPRVRSRCPGIGHGLPRPSRWIDLPLLALRSLASLGDHLVGLITELRRNLPVRLQDLLGWEDLLAVPGGVGGDLRRLRTAVAALVQAAPESAATEDWTHQGTPGNSP